MKHIWTVPCQSSSIDSQTNSLSLFNCIEELRFIVDKSKLPESGEFILPISFQLVSFWLKEDKTRDSTLDLKAEIIDSEKKQLNKFETKFDIDKDKERFRTIINFDTVKINKEGRYYINIMHKDLDKEKFEIVEEIPLEIKIDYLKN